jgi:hypothetical protein
MAKTVLRNNVPALLKQMQINISDLQRMTRLSYPATHNIATTAVLTDDTRVGTLRKVGVALGVSFGDLASIEENTEADSEE